MKLSSWFYNFAEEHPIGIWGLAAVLGFILFVPLAMLCDWLAGRP